MDLSTLLSRSLVPRDDLPVHKDEGQELLSLLRDPFQSQLAAASLLSALGISLGFTAFITLWFSFIRPYNQAIYAPKLKHADEKHAPPPLGKKPWSWITPLTKTKEVALIPQIGLDAVIFLRFLSMCRNMFLCLTVIGVSILVPINVLYSVEKDGKPIKWIIQITPRDVPSGPQWAQVTVAWLFNLIFIFFLWWNYRKVLHLRRVYLESEEYQRSLHSRTLMLYDLPRKDRSDEGIARLIDEVVPNSSFARTAVARNVKDLPDLIHEHNRTVRKLEKILAKYFKNPAQLPAARPSCKPSKKDRSFDSYPKGQKLDAIDYYTQRIRDLEFQIKEVRAGVDKRGTMPYGFASYSDIAEAHTIAYGCRKKKPHGAIVRLARRPTDIIWRNMPLSGASRSRRRWINNLWVVILTLLWIAPNAMIAIFLVNLANLGIVWDGFQQSLQANKNFWGVVQGIASPALMSLIYLVLPIIFRRLSIRAGDQTKTGREQHVLSKLYAFFIFNNLIVFSFFSTIWTFLAGIVDKTSHGTDAWDAITKANVTAAILTSFCNNSPFWVTYLLQRQLGAAIDLAQFWCLIQAFFMKKFSSPTPRELIELTAPPPFDYASYYNYFLFYATVTLCFAGIQPLVLLATALYFSIDCFFKKYLLLYRFVTKTESGGLFWRAIFNRLCFATVLSNFVILLTLWVKGDGDHVQFFCVTPLPFLIVAFKVYCHKTFDDKIKYYSTRSATKAHEAGLPQKESRLRSEKLFSRFGHPALYKPLITPMVNQKAQNLLPSVYRGRLTDGRDAGSAADGLSVGGYSDVYALDSMQGGKPGKSAKNVPGFEYVAESEMDFEFYKNRAEFTDQHGGAEIYGRANDLMRPGTPSSFDDFSDRSISRPASPLSGRSTPFNNAVTDPTYQVARSALAAGLDTPTTTATRGRSPLYMQDNNGSSSALVRNAAGQPIGTPGIGYRGGSAGDAAWGDPGAPSFFTASPPPPAPPATPGPAIKPWGGGGPHGYSGLAQHDDATPGHDNDIDNDSPQYHYFRNPARPTRPPPGRGW